MDDRTFEAMKAAKERFHARAVGIPGVHGTSIGLKQVAGSPTDTIAICIHVTKKRPLDRVPVGERIPGEIDGFPTDVIEHDQPIPHGDRTRPVVGGVQITSRLPEVGTLGCIVRHISDNVLCILTNHHVLRPEVERMVVYQPGGLPDDRIAYVKRTVLDAHVDGAVASLNADVSSDARIEEIGRVAGSYTVTIDDLLANRGYPVRKRGRTTSLTHGRVKLLAYSATRSDGWAFKDQLVIAAADGPFSRPGDSGSVIVDDKRRVVGLLWGGSGQDSYASPIAQVCSRLGIEVVVAPAADPSPPYAETTIGKLEALLCQSDRGRACWEAARRHGSRVQHLFHENPRLHATWLRVPRIEFWDTLHAAVANPDGRIPARIGAEDTVEVLGRLRRALARHAGDAELLRSMTSIHDLIAGSIGATWREALADDAGGPRSRAARRSPRRATPAARPSRKRQA